MVKKQNKIPKPFPQRKGMRISDKATQIPLQISTDEEHPSFRFTHTDKNRWLLSDWTSSEINDLLAGLKKIELYTWGQIKSHGSKKRGASVGTGYKLISNYPTLPDNIPEDVKLSEMRIDEKKRIFGFRVASVYYIIWFDRDHSVCPE
ncbi:MAG TPA: hypothetical protein DEG17_00745 [Cyanobacteria bacterium UBA11149]|nr:hypothetical protein [Cyanobacteria bacterium UBA11367]HBE58418.1 hypothetical protein [Cyanobacteria bacterium UBA11366]HBK64328.1 hypothetical protein [Cyanobacteria bacterium UBA11166]HBR75788.1 hypothetical protein [Cyanobacteria bacterium UBA11159]HBS71082.1 hypothetical protein [Cyanobacteria bacterium UBA11153]HBW87441.1 hypothetical protein [Cyanobacteria bacterium UBA11149]HCA97697.1 hypothetical protein [Cyanobacteria bacterium UBA9226]